ncbi:MAG: HAD-IIA family hydrolase, partial [Candidatus Goldiibacteriota bacterium]
MFGNEIKAVALDLDGTVYTGSTPVEGAVETVKKILEKGIKIFYFTNNSVKTRKEICDKLLKMGLPAEEEMVYNSAYASGRYLKEKEYKSVYCCGSKGLEAEILKSGVDCVTEMPEAVIVGLDETFDYNKMSFALNLLRNEKCLLAACNRDRSYPVEDGRILPGCGPIIAALENACGRSADVVVGKPETYMLEILCGDHRLKAKDILVVGDTYESDIVMA